MTLLPILGIAETFITAADPSTGMITVMAPRGAHLSFGYYSWGPEWWSGVRRKMSSTEEDGHVAFLYENTIARTETPYTIRGTWSQTSESAFRFEATFESEKDTKLVMSQFSMKVGQAFRGQHGVVIGSDGTRKEIPLPFERGSVGDKVSELRLMDDQEQETVLRFDPPATIRADGGDARLAIAMDEVQGGTPYRLSFTLNLPASSSFFPGPESAPESQPGWYAFPTEDTFPPSSELSLANWLDAPAGKYGRIRKEGEQLVLNGSPFKMWGLNVSFANCAPEAELAERRADFYAAMGVNGVRLHKYGEGTGWAGILSDKSAVKFDAGKLDQMDAFVAALKQRGIYTKLSPVFIMPIGPDDAEHIPYLEEFGADRKGWRDPRHGSFYLSRELQDMLILQLRTLLDHRNPYTGLTYAADPAIAFVELYNEDSALFFGTSRAMATSETLRARAGEMFSAWLKNKYQTETGLVEAWGDRGLNAGILSNQKLPRDESWDENRIYPVGNPWFYDPANLETSQLPYKQRLLDTMRFLYELQNHVYDRMVEAVRATGYEGEIISSNWHTGRQMSHFYNLHSDARIGVVDRHNYFGGGGKTYHDNASMLSQPGSGMLSSSLHQVAGRPFMLSEWIHVLPNEWAAEGAALIAAYGMGLQDWDVSFPFQNGDTGTFSPHLHAVWDVTAPNFIGLFPAVSRQVHRGDVKPSDVVHYRNVHIPSLDESRVGFEMQDGASGDIKWSDTDVFPAQGLAAARGLVRFTEEFQETEVFDMRPYLENGEIVSSTGQLRWHAGVRPQDGFFSMHTPANQALVGFTSNIQRDLGDVEVLSHSKFSALYFTAQSPEGTLQDDAILVTAIGRARNQGALVVDDRFVFSPGDYERHRPTGPVLMEPVRASVRIKRPDATVHVLTPHGVKTGRTIDVDGTGRFEVDTGRDQSPYYLITFP